MHVVEAFGDHVVCRHLFLGEYANKGMMLNTQIDQNGQVLTTPGKLKETSDNGDGVGGGSLRRVSINFKFGKIRTADFCP